MLTIQLSSSPHSPSLIGPALTVSYSLTHTLGGQVVAETLQVRGDEEVEEWVLRAIQTGLMEAKMDQMQRVVVIQRCTNRVFGPSQWKVKGFLKKRCFDWGGSGVVLFLLGRKLSKCFTRRITHKLTQL